MDNLGPQLKKIMDQRQVNGRFDDLMATVLHDDEVKAFLAAQVPPLTEAEIMKSSAKLYEFVQQKKKYLAGAEDQLAPGYKPELILNHHFIDVSYVATAELLKQQNQLTILRRVTTFDMPKDIKAASFSKLELTPERASAIDQALAFVESYQAAPKAFHKGLYLSGSFGVGKSYLLGAVAHELAKHGFETYWFTFPRLPGKWSKRLVAARSLKN